MVTRTLTGLPLAWSASAATFQCPHCPSASPHHSPAGPSLLPGPPTSGTCPLALLGTQRTPSRPSAFVPAIPTAPLGVIPLSAHCLTVPYSPFINAAQMSAGRAFPGPPGSTETDSLLLGQVHICSHLSLRLTVRSSGVLLALGAPPQAQSKYPNV